MTGPNVSPAAFYEALPVFVAMHQATGRTEYLDDIVQGMHRFAGAIYQEIADLNGGVPAYNTYWHYEYAMMYRELLHVIGTEQGDAAMDEFTSALAARAAAWGTTTAARDGVYNMTLAAAFWFDLVLRTHPEVSNAADLQAYVDEVWTEFWATQDHNEDDHWYGTADLAVLDAWLDLRGIDWSQYPSISRLFEEIGYAIGNDGTPAAWGDGSHLGAYFPVMAVAERLAAKRDDGVAKWLAHCAFWRGRNELATLSAGLGYANSMYAAMAYIEADDTVREIPPPPAVVLERHARQLTPGEVRYSPGRWFDVLAASVPAKTVLRAGSDDSSPFLILQTGQQAGHGHPDSLNIRHYGMDGSYLLYSGEVRMDTWNEENNVLLLRPMGTGVPWAGTYASLYTTEDVAVPITGSSTTGTFARATVRENEGAVISDTSVSDVLNMVSMTGYAPERAAGYRGWPARVTRDTLLLSDGILVVRDSLHSSATMGARIGQNWVFGVLGEVGSNWVNTWAQKDQSGWFGHTFADHTPLAPVHSKATDTLIWFQPSSEASLEIERLSYSRFLAAPEGLTLKMPPPNYPEFLNTPFRTWYWKDVPDVQTLAFATVFVPHSPFVDAASLASGIRDTGSTTDYSALQIPAAAGEVRTVYLDMRDGIHANGILETDAPCAEMRIAVSGDVTLSLWHATHAAIGGYRLLDVATPDDVVIHCHMVGSQCRSDPIFEGTFEPTRP